MFWTRPTTPPASITWGRAWVQFGAVKRGWGGLLKGYACRTTWFPDECRSHCTDVSISPRCCACVRALSFPLGQKCTQHMSTSLCMHVHPLTRGKKKRASPGCGGWGDAAGSDMEAVVVALTSKTSSIYLQLERWFRDPPKNASCMVTGLFDLKTTYVGAFVIFPPRTGERGKEEIHTSQPKKTAQEAGGGLRQQLLPCAQKRGGSRLGFQREKRSAPLKKWPWRKREKTTKNCRDRWRRPALNCAGWTSLADLSWNLVYASQGAHRMDPAHFILARANTPTCSLDTPTHTRRVRSAPL